MLGDPDSRSILSKRVVCGNVKGVISARAIHLLSKEEREREEKKKRENSFFHKGFRKIKDFFIDTISEEE